MESNQSHIKDDSKNNDTDEVAFLIDMNNSKGRNKKGNKEKDSTASLSHVGMTKRHSIKSNSRTQTKRTTYVHKPQLTAFEKIYEVENVRNKITEEYAKLTLKNYFRAKKSIITKWKTTLELLQNLDAKLFLQALKCLGDIYVEFDEFETAKHFYFYYKFFANYMELLDEVMTAYESLGNVYKFLFQYHKAIKCYKKQIEISWVLNNKVSELRAYDKIGIQYFYLGNKDKAKYYHERMLYGRSENPKSEARDAVSKVYRNKNFHMFNDDKYVKNNRTNDELKDKLR
jgi:tetratricopeptide (TPR) repeat protein